MENLLVSFSGGETSAFMAQWLWKNMRDKYNMIFVFANTGAENEQTLEFIEKCSVFFGFPVVWIEKVVGEYGDGGSFKIVDFKSASRNGEPFEAVIAKYGIPNMVNPHCTSQLKRIPIEKYAKSLGWEDYYLAIGIRADEADRINKNAKQRKIIYPLINSKICPMTKPHINRYWENMPFRLNLKGYQGNCKTCWKKGFRILHQIARENPQAFDFFKSMEDKYGFYVPPTKELKRIKEGSEPVKPPFRFFNNKKSSDDILKEANKYNLPTPIDNSKITPSLELFPYDSYLNDGLVGGDSCEVFSGCGDD